MCPSGASAVCCKSSQLYSADAAVACVLVVLQLPMAAGCWQLDVMWGYAVSLFPFACYHTL